MEQQEDTLGTTLEINTEESSTEERNATVEDLDATDPVPNAKSVGGLKGILARIAAAVKGEEINTRQAREIRSQIGVSQAYFTRHTPDKAKRRTRNKIADASRKANRRKTKGIANRKGQHFSSHK